MLSLATVHWAAPRFKNFGKLDKALRYQAELRFDLRDALAKAGGATAFKACGKATAGKFSVPLAAWYLDEHTLDVGLVPAPQGVIVAARTTNKQSLKPQPEQPYPPGYAPVQTVRTTTLFSTCPRPPAAAPSASLAFGRAWPRSPPPAPGAGSRSCARPTRCSPVRRSSF